MGVGMLPAVYERVRAAVYERARAAVYERVRVCPSDPLTVPLRR